MTIEKSLLALAVRKVYYVEGDSSEHLMHAVNTVTASTLTELCNTVASVAFMIPDVLYLVIKRDFE